MYALGHELAQTPSQKFDLVHMRVLLAALENPERRFPAVLIAGTNGKGSTAATLASILRASGLRVGLYTSPHLVEINERIQINGESREVAVGSSLQELIVQLGFPVQRVAIELNRDVVRRTDWPNTLLSEDDRVEIVHFVGGG